MERKIGEVFKFDGEWYQCVEGSLNRCVNCCFYNGGHKKCSDKMGECFKGFRSDNHSVYFKKLEKVGEPYYNSDKKLCQQYKCYTEPLIADEMVYVFADNRAVIEIKQNKEDMEVKIQIPDNCELIKDGDTYIVKERKQQHPRSWEEFCEKHPIQLGEVKLNSVCDIYGFEKGTIRHPYDDRDIYTSKEEAKAFLALMQLRQLRKAWVGDWTNVDSAVAYSIYVDTGGSLEVAGFGVDRVLNFPTNEMAEDFLGCFKDLCETAKILL